MELFLITKNKVPGAGIKHSFTGNMQINNTRIMLR